MPGTEDFVEISQDRQHFLPTESAPEHEPPPDSRQTTKPHCRLEPKLKTPVTQPTKPVLARSPMHEPDPNTSFELNSPQDLGQFDLLYPERKYLLATLRAQIETATDLLQKIPPLEEALASNEQPHLRRSTKKQLGWLRCRVKEATRQEKAIVIQLNQISQEIYSRERCMQAQFEQFQNLHQHQLCQYYGPFRDPQMTIYEERFQEPVHLNPLSAEFVPRDNIIPYLNGSAHPRSDCQPTSRLNGCAAMPRPDLYAGTRPVHLGSDEPLRYYPRVFRPPMQKRRSSSMDDGKSATLATTPSHVSKHQTHSLPSTTTIDEQSEEEQTAADLRKKKEFGYFDLPLRN